jgi:hypothetical protein
MFSKISRNSIQNFVSFQNITKNYSIDSEKRVNEINTFNRNSQKLFHIFIYESENTTHSTEIQKNYFIDSDKRVMFYT